MFKMIKAKITEYKEIEIFGDVLFDGNDFEEMQNLVDLKNKDLKKDCGFFYTLVIEPHLVEQMREDGKVIQFIGKEEKLT